MKTDIVFMITLYQKYISPRKGFRCAHAFYYGGLSCSQAVKAIVDEQGVWRALLYSEQRFRECRRSVILLRSERKKKKDEAQDKRWESCDFGLEACDCISGISGIVRFGKTA